ncbi:MAG: AI-2E family transporter [Myxococcota bacterium]|nr:AI-2E family transporter [Myxococcota bacterium]
MRILISLVCACALLGFAHLAASIIVPFLLALAVATAFQPISYRISRRGWPPVVTAVVSATTMLSIVGGAGLIVYVAATDLAASLPQYTGKVQELQIAIADWLSDRSAHIAARSVLDYDVSEPMTKLAQTSLMSVGSYLPTLFFVLVITAFIQLETRHYRRKLIKAFDGPAPIRGMMAGLHEVQRYMLVKLIVSCANGVFLGVWCWAWGVDSPLMWGVLAFALNFIPVIGSLIAAVPPIALALLSDGFSGAAGVATGYVLVNLVVDMIIEPRVMGRALGLSPLVVLLAMLIWGFVLGPVGAILAVPLTMAIKIMLEHDPELARIALLMGDGSNLTTPPVVVMAPERPPPSVPL